MSDDDGIRVAGENAHRVRVGLVLLHGAQLRQEVDVARAETHGRSLEREAGSRTWLHEKRTHNLALRATHRSRLQLKSSHSNTVLVL